MVCAVQFFTCDRDSSVKCRYSDADTVQSCIYINVEYPIPQFFSGQMIPILNRRRCLERAIITLGWMMDKSSIFIHPVLIQDCNGQGLE